MCVSNAVRMAARLTSGGVNLITGVFGMENRPQRQGEEPDLGQDDQPDAPELGPGHSSCARTEEEPWELRSSKNSCEFRQNEESGCDLEA